MIEYGADEAITKTGSPSATAIRDAIENMKDVPVFTSNLTIEPDTHNPHNKPVIIMEITDSQWKITKTYTP